MGDLRTPMRSESQESSLFPTPTFNDWWQLVAKVADEAYSVLEPLRKTELARIPSKYRPLTSFNSRGCRVSMGTYLLSSIRDALNMFDPIGGEPSCDCALLKGGNVRGGRDYEDDEHLTLEVLQSEMEETKEILIIPVPGFLLRIGLCETWTVPNPGWMQFDDGIELDQNGFVEKVHGKPLDVSKVYKVASIVDFWRKRDSPSIGAYFEIQPGQLPEHDSGYPVHALLIRLFAMDLWARIWKALGINIDSGEISAEAFSRMDFDKDGKLSREDIRMSIESLAHFHTFAGQDVVVNYMFDEIASFARQESDTEHLHLATLATAAKHLSSTSLSNRSMDDESDDDEAVPA